MSHEAYIRLMFDMSDEFFDAFFFWEESTQRPARPDHWGLYCAGHEL